MICTHCEGKGYTESFYGAGASWTPTIQMCPKRCNISGYSAEVQKRLNDPNRVTAHQVLKAKPSERPKAGQVIQLFGKRESHDHHQ